MPKNNFEDLPLYDKLVKKIHAYYSTIWIDKKNEGDYLEWLKNFSIGTEEEITKERLNALFLLSKFMYFGNKELREMLKCIFRDLYKYPIIEQIRINNNDTTDSAVIDPLFEDELEKTIFLGIGNPSESGVHLLYYFRQENDLNISHFKNVHEIFNDTIKKEKDLHGNDRVIIEPKFQYGDVKRYIFLDDFCCSGTQAKEYSTKVVERIKLINPEIEVNYLMLFGTKNGIKEVVTHTKFDKVECIFELDETFKCFGESSRYFLHAPAEIDKTYCKTLSQKYGRPLYPMHPLGYKDGQMLLGMFHNTPDNCLPIIWSDFNWKPIFKRYHKNS